MRDRELYATILGVTAPWTVGRRPGTTDAPGHRRSRSTTSSAQRRRRVQRPDASRRRAYPRSPGAGNDAVSSFTSAKMRSIASSSDALAASTPSSIHRAMCFISSGPMPRLVTDGVPMRSPDGLAGGRGSNGTALKFSSSPARSRAFAVGLPRTSLFVRSIRMRWLSVPPETRSNPRASSSSASTFAFATTSAAYERNSGVAASFSATAIAAVV